MRSKSKGIALTIICAVFGCLIIVVHNVSCVVCGGSYLTYKSCVETHDKILTEEFMRKFNIINYDLNNCFSFVEAREKTYNTAQYYLNFNGDKDEFVPMCTEFAIRLIDMGSHADKWEHYYITIWFEDRYFVCNRDNSSQPYPRCFSEIQTNFYFDDYSVLETIPNITECCISTKSFTAEQRQQLDSIKNNYSFKIILSE